MDLARPMTSHFVDRAFGLVLFTFRLPFTIVNLYLDLHTSSIFFYLSCNRSCRTVTLLPPEVDLQFIDSFVDTLRLLIPQCTC